jgi:hypothetical protein
VTAEQYRYPYLDSSVFIAWLKLDLENDSDQNACARAPRCRGSASMSLIRLAASSDGLNDHH